MLEPVPFDPEISPVIDALNALGYPQMTRESLIASRSVDTADRFGSTEDAIAGRPVEAEERRIPGPEGAPELEVTILRPSAPRGSGPLPGLYNIHGGGMVMGHRSWETKRLVDLVAELGVVIVNVEYRLAPEHPFPAGVDDCYAGLNWMADNASELGVDPARIVVMGGSAGGGFSAALALLARDRGYPAIAGQLLLCPMIDNTNSTASSYQYAGLGTWQRESNLLAWQCVLGDEFDSMDASQYAAPSRAGDVSQLPPAFIEAGSAELFRDEDVAYASRIWATGGQAELHIWAGGFHGFDIYAPDSELTSAALAARLSWLRRVLGIPQP